MEPVKIKSALISVFQKDGLEDIIHHLNLLGVTIFSTGGTKKYIESLNIPVRTVESLTSYPSILDGRVKTLHPKVFGGILARREDDHIAQLENYDIPQIDLVIVDLYPFEDTVKSTNDETSIIEKIDIGGIALIRAAAKNYRDVLVIPSKNQYAYILEMLKSKQGFSDLEDRRHLATQAFKVSSHYDYLIYNHFNGGSNGMSFKHSIHHAMPLRYGENPHQNGVYFGELNNIFDKLGGKEISFNNLVDIDGAVQIMSEFKDAKPTFAILKHTNACGLASRDTILEAWKDALAGDPISAFGGILIANSKIDKATAEEIDKIFYEVLIAPEYDTEALEFLLKKKKRIIMKIKAYPVISRSFKSVLDGVIQQDQDQVTEHESDLKVVTSKSPEKHEMKDLLFANKCVKHLKSNTITLVKNEQLIGMGCGQTSRVDALKQAITKANAFNFDLHGAVMASDAFFPFPDCVEIADKAGIRAVIQPGGSIKDQLSIDYCNTNQVAMVFSGNRHFKH
jgi:phosphoribosylaminoimidazolecarboxamide formyltransferase/IMP cyclohydrolase